MVLTPPSLIVESVGRVPYLSIARQRTRLRFFALPGRWLAVPSIRRKHTRMVINLDKPFSCGDLAPGQTYSHCYATKFASYGNTATLAVTYQFGTMEGETAHSPGTWTPCPYNTDTRIEMTGQRLAPFYTMMGDPSVSVWAAVETVVYEQIQANDARCAGTIGVAVAPASSSDSSSNAST